MAKNLDSWIGAVDDFNTFGGQGNWLLYAEKQMQSHKVNFYQKIASLEEGKRKKIYAELAKQQQIKVNHKSTSINGIKLSDDNLFDELINNYDTLSDSAKKFVVDNVYDKNGKLKNSARQLASQNNGKNSFNSDLYSKNTKYKNEQLQILDKDVVSGKTQFAALNTEQKNDLKIYRENNIKQNPDFFKTQNKETVKSYIASGINPDGISENTALLQSLTQQDEDLLDSVIKDSKDVNKTQQSIADKTLQKKYIEKVSATLKDEQKIVYDIDNGLMTDDEFKKKYTTQADIDKIQDANTKQKVQQYANDWKNRTMAQKGFKIGDNPLLDEQMKSANPATRKAYLQKLTDYTDTTNTGFKDKHFDGWNLTKEEQAGLLRQAGLNHAADSIERPLKTAVNDWIENPTAERFGKMKDAFFEGKTSSGAKPNSIGKAGLGLGMLGGFAPAIGGGYLNQALRDNDLVQGNYIARNLGEALTNPEYGSISSFGASKAADMAMKAASAGKGALGKLSGALGGTLVGGIKGSLSPVGFGIGLGTNMLEEANTGTDYGGITAGNGMIGSIGSGLAYGVPIGLGLLGGGLGVGVGAAQEYLNYKGRQLLDDWGTGKQWNPGDLSDPFGKSGKNYEGWLFADRENLGKIYGISDVEAMLRKQYPGASNQQLLAELERRFDTWSPQRIRAAYQQARYGGSRYATSAKAYNDALRAEGKDKGFVEDSILNDIALAMQGTANAVADAVGDHEELYERGTDRFKSFNDVVRAAQLIGAEQKRQKEKAIAQTDVIDKATGKVVIPGPQSNPAIAAALVAREGSQQGKDYVRSALSQKLNNVYKMQQVDYLTQALNNAIQSQQQSANALLYDNNSQWVNDQLNNWYNANGGVQ